jgi:DNA-binding transcriptional ArsR family regulator
LHEGGKAQYNEGNAMLRIHFTDADLAQVTVASTPDPLWEVALSLQRFQTRSGLSSYAEWHRTARTALHGKGLAVTVRNLLLPIFPRCAYFPDFLTPVQASEGLDAGLAAIMSTPRHQVLRELNILDRVNGMPSWIPRLAAEDTRRDLVQAIRAYHDTAIAPCGERMQACVDADRSVRARALLDAGTDGLLAGFRPWMRWQRPVLEIDYPEDRDLYLNGRGLLLIPSYFCWGGAVSLADSDLPPVLAYPLDHGLPRDAHPDKCHAKSPLTVLLGSTRAAILRAVATGTTTGELARAVGVSDAAASRHTAALRDAGLVVSQRNAAVVLHAVTPVGTALLRASASPTRSGTGRLREGV